MLLNYVNIPFEDVRFTFEDWEEEKKKSDFFDKFEYG